jgi:hypothetical protein
MAIFIRFYRLFVYSLDPGCENPVNPGFFVNPVHLQSNPLKVWNILVLGLSVKSVRLCVYVYHEVHISRLYHVGKSSGFWIELKVVEASCV